MNFSFSPFTLTAPAKVNLALHILNKRDDGYHNLDSLVTFTDFGDEILFEPASEFDFGVTGNFSDKFSHEELDSSPSGTNSIVRAAHGFSKVIQVPLKLKITLTKNLPPASGIGGGSSDAATAIKGLCSLHELSENSELLAPLLQSSGADVPVCMHAQSCRMSGTGNIINPVPVLPKTPIILINPLIPCPTGKVFQNNSTYHFALPSFPDIFSNSYALCDYLKNCSNSLESAAIKLIPEIAEILNRISKEYGCLHSGMSGSGATCFALFSEKKYASEAAKTLKKDCPGWWIQEGFIQ